MDTATYLLSHSEVKNQEQVSWRKVSSAHHVLLLSSVGNRWSVCLRSSRVCNDDAVLLGCRFIVLASRPVQLFSPLMAFSAALYAVDLSPFHDFPPVSTPCIKAPGCDRDAVRCCAALQGCNTYSCRRTLTFHSLLLLTLKLWVWHSSLKTTFF